MAKRLKPSQELNSIGAKRVFADHLVKDNRIARSFIWGRVRDIEPQYRDDEVRKIKMSYPHYFEQPQQQTQTYR